MKKAAQSEYEASRKALEDFCCDNTDFEVFFIEDDYPFSVRFMPKAQVAFEDENENGDVKDGAMTVTVGLSTSVLSTLTFRTSAKLLKKVIKLSEKAGNAYYQAFREAANESVMPEVTVEYEN